MDKYETEQLARRATAPCEAPRLVRHNRIARPIFMTLCILTGRDRLHFKALILPPVK